MIEENREVPNTNRRSADVRGYELVDKEGNVVGRDPCAPLLGDLARVRWPDQEQDPEESGNGWNVRKAGAPGY